MQVDALNKEMVLLGSFSKYCVLNRQYLLVPKSLTVKVLPLFVSQALIMRGINIMEFKRRSGDGKTDGKSRPTSEAKRGELSVLANQRA